MRREISIVLLALAACSGGEQEPHADQQASTERAKSYFQSAVVPIFAENCTSCHLTGQEAGNMSLVPDAAFSSLVNVASKEAPQHLRVKPGDAASSYLLMKVEGTHIKNGGTGSKMPLVGEPLKSDQISIIRKWITDGAKP